MALAAKEKARSGVRNWVLKAGVGLRTATPYGIVAMLAASAAAPVAGVALGASVELTAVLTQLGGMGSNYLADTLLATARRMRGSDPDGDEWRDAVAAELLAQLSAGDERAAALRDEVAGLLHAVGAVDVALREADEEVRAALALAFGALGEDVGRLQLLAADAASVLAAMQQQLAEQGRTQRQHTDLLRQSLVITAQLHQEVIGRRPERAEVTREQPDPDAPNPYPGLASFQATDARYFYGRENLVAELLGRLSEQFAGGPPVVVVGVSGVGKSSLLRAGVLPAVANGGLAEGSAAWPWLVMTPGPTPLAELAGRTATLAGLEPEAVSADPAGFGALAAQAAGEGRLIIVVDQFEELFTQCADPAERAAFVEALANAAPALVLIAVRADFYPQCTELAAMLPMLGAGQVLVGPLRTDELRRAVREPAADAGLRLEPGLEELLLTDLGALTGPAGYEPGALPLLAHALRATWADREGMTMTVAGYRRTGGIRHAVAETAERSYLGLDPADRVALRSALLGLVTVVDNLTVRRPAARADTDVDVLRPLIDARLVTAGLETVEISHDALLTNWPRLGGWLTEAREEILVRQRLTQATADWVSAGDDPDLLYRGARLAAAREWATGRTDLPDAQQRFLAVGAAAASAELLAQRRSTRRLRRLVAGLAVALLVAVGGAVLALDQRGLAQQQSREARSRQLAAESRTELSTDQPDAVRKALAAWAAAHTIEARSALLAAEQTTTIGHLGTEQRAVAVAVSPDGRLVAVAQTDGRIQLWDSSTLQRVGPELRHLAGSMFSLRFSPDGRYLASGAIARDGVVLWEVPSGRLTRRLPGMGAVAWLPDSSAVLATRSEGAPAGQIIAAWDPDDGRLTGTTRSTAVAALSLAVSPDGKYLALAGAIGGGQLLRRSDGRSMAALPSAEDVVFAADDTVATRDEGGVVTRWDARTGRKIATLTDASAEDATSGRMAVTPDGTLLVQGDEVRTIHALKLDGGGNRPLLTGFRGAAGDLSLSADGQLLAVAGLNAPPTLIRLGVDRLPHPQVVGYLAYDPTGTRLATGSDDPVVRVWDPRTSNLTSTIEIQSSAGPLGLAYAPDGTLAAATAEGTVQVFGPGGRSRGVVRVEKFQFVGRPVFSPDGSLLAVPVDVREPVDATTDADRNRQDEAGLVDVLVWDTATLTPRARLETPGHQSIAVTFTPDGSQLVAATNRAAALTAPTGPAQDGALWSWRTADMSLAGRRDLPGIGIADLKISADGTLVAVAGTSRRVELFTTDGLNPAGSIAEHSFELSRLDYSQDGRTLATVSNSDDDVVRLWDIRTGTRIAELRAQGSAVQALQFSPNGTMLATGSGDWTVALWHIDPDDAVRRLCSVAVPAARADNVAVPELCR